MDDQNRDGEGQQSLEVLSLPPEEKDPILEYFVRLAPLIQELIPLDCMIGISDREKFLYNLDGREIKNPKAIPGKPIPGESGLSKAIQKEGTVRITVSGETYGGPAFKTTTVPVRDEAGRVIGAVGLALSLSAQDALTEVAGTVATLARDASMAVEGLAESAQNLTRHHETLLSVVEEVRQQVSKTETILGFIREVAGKSNLLGLNAAIEAARAGEGGRGFSVVAEEIRKMSAYSTNSVKEIKDILVAINEKVGKMAKSISQVSDEAQNEAAATEEISASVQELATLAQKIETVAQII